MQRAEGWRCERCGPVIGGVESVGEWRLSAEGEREKVSEVWACDGGVDRMRGLNVSAEGSARELCEVWAGSSVIV